MGPAWLAGLAVAALWRRRPSLALGVTAVLALGLGLATAARNVTYSDEIRFWQDVTSKTPLNGRGWNNLGYACALAGRNADAERAFRRAIEVDPRNTKAAVNLALLLDGYLLPATTRR
jgi:protein O-mannosyl-transferase